MTQLRFALAQIDTCVGALDANAAKVLDYSRKAAAGNAQVVVFPEMTLTGYPIEDLALRRTFRQAAWDKANELATQLNDDGLGAIVNSSRGIMCAWKKTGNNGEDYKEAARAEAIRMRDDIVAAIK